MQDAINLQHYRCTDAYFGAPYIDRDEWCEGTCPHRLVHGGFDGTDTRFTFYFPDRAQWRGRLFQPLEGAHAGHEDAFGGFMGEILGGGVALTARLGGFMVESNSGHIGDTMDERAGPDPALYGHRASIETARLAKFVAAQVYGEPPKYAYVWGGSGGGRRSPLCLEYGAGVYDGALPFMGGGNIDQHGTTACAGSEQSTAFGSMFNVQRLLGDRLADVIDATQPGGNGDPYAGLDTHQREELANLYRLGFPRGDEYMISQPMGQMWLWASTADMLIEGDPDYFEAFWTRPGYIGHDLPAAVEADLIDCEATVSRVITAGEFLADAAFAGPEFGMARAMAQLMAKPQQALAIELADLGPGYRLGTGIRVLTGAAAGRQLYCYNHVGDLLFGDGRGEANLQRFDGVRAGDRVRVDNRPFLAFCYFYRHHLADDPIYDFLRPDGWPLYPQHKVPTQSPLMGVPYSGRFDGKLLWVHHTHDASLWPFQGTVYERAVKQTQGEAAAERFCLRWSENAEHVPPFLAPSSPQRANSTWLIDYNPIIEQSLLDLCDWVEKGIRPAATSYRFRDGKVILPATAAERGGIQPVVALRANGGARAEARCGEPVALQVQAELPAGAGALIELQWDFDGRGSYPERQKLSGLDTALSATVSHTYEQPGTYFATAQVFAHRDGDVEATSRRIPNLASVRVVVT